MLLRRFTLAILIGGVSVSPAFAQSEKVDSAANARIRKEGLENSHLMHTAIMLSDAQGGRLAGSPSYKKAAEWAVKELTSYGTLAFLEPWGSRKGNSWEVVRYSVEMTEPYYSRVTAYPKGWSPSTRGTIKGSPKIVSIRSDSDVVKYHGQLRGAILFNGRAPLDTAQRFRTMGRRFTDAELDSLARMTDPGEPRDYWDDAGGYPERAKQTNDRYIAIGNERAAVMLQPSRGLDAVMAEGYQSYNQDMGRAVPGFFVDRGEYQRIVNLIDNGVPVKLEISLKTRIIKDDHVGFNVIAEIEGSDPALRDEVVMLGGHFDSYPPASSATDNAAGSAVAIEVMRILKAIDAHPRRTIRIGLWDGEEHEDYFGSLGYVKKHFGDPETMQLLPDQSKISAYFNFDNGTGRVRGIYMQGNAAVRPIFSQYLAPFKDLGASTLTIKNAGSTDHMPFTSVGIPAFTFIQDPIDYETRTHHSNRDLAAYLLENDLKQAAVITASVVLHTANRDALLPRSPLPPPRKK
jgi:hypothetical protein